MPARFQKWFKAQGWQPRPHQLEMVQCAASGHAALLVAPTGGGKTLAGFLPALIDLAGRGRGRANAPQRTLHTLYISPLKALAVDIARNLHRPIADMGLDITVETRTGDTPPGKRRRQRARPPDILITTPEQIALMIAAHGMERFFGDLKFIILDELHALVASKRGSLLSLGLARLARLAPDAVPIGLSATVADPENLTAWLVPQSAGAAVPGTKTMAAGETPPRRARLITGAPGARPHITVLDSAEHIPWSGHSARHAIGEIYNAISAAAMTLVFVNTRSQAEIIFQELWRSNAANLPIALHHGSLDAGRRRKVEKAMGEHRLRAIVCTSTLDLGIDWGGVDLVINAGAPKGSSRILQRIGRANHRLDEPSRALLVPASRFEVLECEAARLAALEGSQDTEPAFERNLDVLAQHIFGLACAGPFFAAEMFAEVRSAWAYRHLTRQDFDDALDFIATGGYALRAYERYARLRPMADGRLRLAHPRLYQQYAMNVGAIVAAEVLKVRLVKRRKKPGRRSPFGGRVLGEIEEYFISQLVPGDTFVFAGQVVRFEAIEEMSAIVTPAFDSEPKVPSYMGGKFPLSTWLAEKVRIMLADPARWQTLPDQVAQWLSVQQEKSLLPGSDQMLVETFPRGQRFYLVCYPFEGRLAHQTLGMLLTRRLQRAGLGPMGFVANDYALVISMMADAGAAIRAGRLVLAQLFSEDMLGDDLDAWLAESSLMKRTFRNCAVIAGLIERRAPGREKTGRQVTVSSDLIYDVLRAHDPGHVLLRAAWHDAASGLIDVHRLAGLLRRIRHTIVHSPLTAVSPLAVPVMLEIGRVPVYGQTHDSLLSEAAGTQSGDAASARADDLINEAMRPQDRS